MPEGHGGLTDFGRRVIREMNRMGMIVDVSHVSDATFRDALDVSVAPVAATHSGARALCDHPRNLSDDMLRALAARGGVAQVVFFPGFLDPGHAGKVEAIRAKRVDRERAIRDAHRGDPERMRALLAALYREVPLDPAPLTLLADHIEHMVNLVGPDHVGIGADWDGVSLPREGDAGLFPLAGPYRGTASSGLRRGDGEEDSGGKHPPRHGGRRGGTCAVDGGRFLYHGEPAGRRRT